VSDWLSAIHDPDVVLTDLALAVLGAYLGWRLWIMPGKKRLPRAGALLLGALASAAFWGAIFHALFQTERPPLRCTCLEPSRAFDRRRCGNHARPGPGHSGAASGTGYPPVHRDHVCRELCCGCLLLDRSFTSIVYFYVPALLLLLLAAARRAISGRSIGWTLVAAGLLMSVGAAVLQQARVAIHPVYFDHNAVYHAVQSIAILFLYVGWRRAPASV